MGIYKERLIERRANRQAAAWTPIIERHRDPVRWEVAYWRLLGIVGEGREIARQISASPTVKEFGECVFALFTPEGESIAFSRGILLHMASMGSAIQWMLMNDYEEDPGINSGDIFYNNDPQIGGAHSADQGIMMPVYYRGELIAWVAGLTHCMETGSTEPGGMAPSALSRYDDGQMVPCMKVGVNDRFNRDFHIMVERNTRDGKWWILDDRAKLAGCLKMRDSLLSLIEEMGVDYFKTVSLEMLEEGRQSALRKTKKVLFPGRYRTPGLNDVPFADPMQRVRIPRDYIMHVPCEMTVEADGYITFDYDGVSSHGYHSNNASWPCTLGNHLYTMLQDVYYDGMFNNGMEDAFALKIPENSCNNSGIQYACSAWAAAHLSVAACVTRNLALSYYAMGFREEGFACKAATMAILTGGIDQYGMPFAALNFEMNCSGMGAQSNVDGLHTANSPWNPEANLSDSEMFEHVWPLIWLGREIQMDGGGFGRKQGGASISSTYVIEHDIKFIESGAIGSMDKICMWGIMGGYPTPSRYKYALVNTDYADRVAQELPLPHSEGEDPAYPEFARLLNGTLKRYPGQQSADQYQRYDILHQTSGGGGGWGDPIERDPAAVMLDMKMGVTSARSASDVYCIVWNSDTMEVDVAATAAKRQDMRQRRLQRGIPAKEYKKMVRDSIIAGDVPPIPKDTYNDCFSRSQKFLAEFKEFWELDDGFTGF